MRGWARYLTPAAAHRELGLVCLGVGRREGNVSPCPRRVLDCYGAVLLHAGRGRLEYGSSRESTTLVAPTLLWLPPGIPHAYGPHPTGWSETWMLFEGAAARGYENLGYITPDDPVAALSNPLPVRRAFERLLARCRDASPTVDVEAAALVHQVVAESRHAKMAPQRKDTAILASLREDASLRLTVERHARRLGMSVADLRAVVQRSASCSPKDYITRTRLNNAKTMLAESDAPIARVASEVGYDDPAYFTRLFTRRVGAAPREFRNQRRGLSRAVGGP